MFKLILIFTLSSSLFAASFCECNIFENDSKTPIFTGQIDSLKPGAVFTYKDVKCFFVSTCNEEEQEGLSIMCRAYAEGASYSACNGDDVNLTIAANSMKLKVRCRCSEL